MEIRHPIVVAAVLMAAGLTGCGGGESDSPSPAPGSSQAQNPDSTSQPKGDAPAKTPQYGAKGETRVAMLDLRFEPLEVSVKPGAKVTFVNEGKVTHNAKSDHFFTRVVEPGDEKTVRASRKSGTYRYVCTFHPGMEATLRVKG